MIRIDFAEVGMPDVFSGCVMRAKIAQPRVRMEGWRQRRPGSNARNPREGKRKQKEQTEKEKNALDSYRPSHGRHWEISSLTSRILDSEGWGGRHNPAELSSPYLSSFRRNYRFDIFIPGRPCANADGAGYHRIDNARATVRVVGRRVPQVAP